MKNGLIINERETSYYYLNDKLHREDGPAIERRNGDKEWWTNGHLHREDGPACEYAFGKFYFLNDQEFFEQDYWKEIERRKSLGYILSKIKFSPRI